MEKTLPDTYLPGQSLQADTFWEALPIQKGQDLKFPAPLLVGTNGGGTQTEALPDPSTKDAGSLEFLIRPPVVRRVPVGPSPVLRPRQQWEGTVLELNSGSFVARVSDRTNPANVDELATFDFDEISVEDRSLVAPGATFYWTIGTERSPAGTIKNVEFVNFRRLPRWSSSSLREAKQEARDLASLLFSE